MPFYTAPILPTAPSSLFWPERPEKERPIGQTWIGLPVTAIAASLIASECVGWAWQV
jgi:hypothetical protein